jgi:hypothetical protein
MHWEPDEEPSISAWIELRQTLASHPATIMLWESAPLPQTVARLAEQGIASVPFDTLANRPAQSDYLSAMNQNARRLETVFRADDQRTSE